jgi:hypothetical protein
LRKNAAMAARISSARGWSCIGLVPAVNSP